jgi:hypothetical protein
MPIRVFARDDVGSLQLTRAATDSGVWFDPAVHVAEYKKLWRVPHVRCAPGGRNHSSPRIADS